MGSVRAVTNAAGLKAERSLFRPFGEAASTRFDLSVAVETKGFIGQRFDADAGLQYLNARYYDPKLAMFLQPDWWEVTRAGVGTNRYGYSGGDPVNLSDPSGHRTMTPEQAKQSELDARQRASQARHTRYAQNPLGGRPGGLAGPLTTSIGPGGMGIPNKPSSTGVGTGGSAGKINPFSGGSRKEATQGTAAGKTTATGQSAADSAKPYVDGSGTSSTGRASLIDRGAFAKERASYWKKEAQTNSSNYRKDDLARMQQGKPPIGSDGHPVELHHMDRTMEGGLQPMTRTDHRLGENYKRNHPPE